MTPKNAGTPKEATARVKNASVAKSGSKKMKPQMLPSHKRNPRMKTSGGEKVNRVKKPLDKRSEELKALHALLLKERRERRQAEKNSEHLASFPRINPNPVLEVNSFGEVIFHNNAAAKILKELHQGEKTSLFLPDDVRLILKSLSRKKEKRFSREVRICERTFEENIYTAPSFKTFRIYATDISARKQAEKDLLTTNQRLSLLSDTSAQLLATKNPQEIVKKLCKKVMQHLGCDIFFNYLVDEGEGRLRLNAYTGIPAKAAKKIEWLDYGVAVCGTAARDGITIIAEDIPANPDQKTDLVKSYGIKSYACHPLLSRRKLIGTLSFGSKTKTAFSDDEIDLMKTIAYHVSIAMERLQSHIEMETKVRERTAALSITLEALQKKMAELNLAKDILAEQSEQLESFFSHTITPLVFLDPDFNFIRVNDAYAKACNRSASEFPGHNHFEFYPNEENKMIFEKVVRTKVPYQVVSKPFIFPDHPEWGTTYWDWVLFPVLDNNDEVVFLVFSLQDVTERTLAEQAIYESEKKYRGLIEQSADGIVIFDRQLNFIDANPMASQISGFSREELMRMQAGDLVPEEEMNIVHALADKVVAGETVRQETEVLGRNGRHIPVEISAKMLEDGNIQTIIRNITDRKKTEEELRGSQEQLRNLYLHLQSVREEERTYIAREIHDEFGTILTALKIDLSWLQKQMFQENKAFAGKIERDLDLINSAIKTVQKISSELRPGILDHLGLAAAIEWQVKEFCSRAGITWDLSINLGSKPDRHLSTTMFRILQESLTNIARHAEATSVRVNLTEKDRMLVLEVTDNGKGVTEEQLSDRRSFGLIGMRERAQHLGGDVSIKRADGKGTKVLVKIPKEEEA